MTSSDSFQDATWEGGENLWIIYLLMEEGDP